MDKDPKTWSMSHYKLGRCCDLVENGHFESFISVIVDARKKPIITMLEEIRLYMMERVQNESKWDGMGRQQSLSCYKVVVK